MEWPDFLLQDHPTLHTPGMEWLYAEQWHPFGPLGLRLGGLGPFLCVIPTVPLLDCAAPSGIPLARRGPHTHGNIEMVEIWKGANLDTPVQPAAAARASTASTRPGVS